MDAIPSLSTASVDTPSTTAPARKAAGGTAAEDPTMVNPFIAALTALTDVAPAPNTFVAAADGQALPSVGPALAALPGPRRAAIGVATGATATASDLAAAAPPLDEGSRQSAAGAVGLGPLFASVSGVTPTDRDTAASITSAATKGLDLGDSNFNAATPEHAPGNHLAGPDASMMNMPVRGNESTGVNHSHDARPMPLPLAQPELFSERLNQQIAVMLTQNAQHARIDVNPPDLGPVEVRISMVGDEATIQLAAPHASTRDALADALPRLRASFADSGIALGHAGVFAELPQQRQPHPQTASAQQLERFVTEHEAVPSVVLNRTLKVGLIDAFV